MRGPNCGLLATTRKQELSAGLHMGSLPLDMLTEDEALALMAARIGVRGEIGDSEDGDWEIEAARELVRRLGYHPLAVELAAAQIGRGRHSFASLLAPLRAQRPGSLDALTLTKDDRMASLQTCFDLSVDALDPDLARAWRQLGVLAPDALFAAEDAAALWQTDETAALDTLHTLADAALLTRVTLSLDHPVNFRMHLLLRDDALTRLRQHDELVGALQRHAQHYAEMASKRDRHVVARSHNQLEAIFRRSWRMWMHDEDAIDDGLVYPPEMAARLLNSLAFDCNNGYWDLAGLYAQGLLWLPRAAYAAERSDNHRDQGAHLGNLGLAYADLGRVEEAIGWHEQALAISREISDRRGEGANLCNLGSVYRRSGDSAKAGQYYRLQLPIVQEIGDRGGEANAIWGIGNCLDDKGETDAAITHFQTALEIFTALGYRREQALLAWNLAICYERREEYVRAAELMQLLVDFYREIGHPEVDERAQRLDEVRGKAELDG